MRSLSKSNECTQLKTMEASDFKKNAPTQPEITKFECTLDDEELKFTIYDFIRSIKDPEKPNTLEDLNVVYEDGVIIKGSSDGRANTVRIEFNPTVPHCSLATLIGLCIRIKLERCLPYQLKFDIFIKAGAHATEDEINKQINDKERIAAAMENPKLKEMVENCIKEED